MLQSVLIGLADEYVTGNDCCASTALKYEFMLHGSQVLGGKKPSELHINSILFSGINFSSGFPQRFC